MKGINLFCSKLSVYLSEVPLIILLIVAIRQNGKFDTLLKLYPLIVLLIIGMLFIFVYYFRIVNICAEEVRSVGIFSGRDKAILKKGRTLTLTLWKKSKMVVEVFGNGESPALDWVDPEDYKDMSVNLFRAKAVGREGSVKRILRYFEIDDKDFAGVFGSGDFRAEYDTLILEATTKNEQRSISLTFKETI